MGGPCMQYREAYYEVPCQGIYTVRNRKEDRVKWITAFLSALAAGVSATLATQETNYGDWLTTTVGLSVFWALSTMIWALREERR